MFDLTMDINRTKEFIEEAKKRFDRDLHTAEYARVHHDSEQLERLLSLLGATRERTFLDLGTGDGYVAMALAVRDPTCKVVGLDIAAEAIGRCTDAAKKQGVPNVEFQTFEGFALPLDDNSIDGVLCRYAFHHFPACETTVADISRITRCGGRFVFSDPARHEVDTLGFVDSLQSLQKDGHVRIYPREEVIELCGRHDLELLDHFETSVSFSRNLSSPYRELLASTPTRVLNAYCVQSAENLFSAKFDIMNMVFLNRKNRSHPIDADSAD